jgi:hypothetical protein
MAAIPQSIVNGLSVAAAFSTLLALLFQALIVLVITRSLAAYQAEIEKIDSLVSEYVRCRDVLLAARRPSAESGWRTAETGAFRESWHNFNLQLDRIRDRHHGAHRGLSTVLHILLAFLVLNGINAAWFAASAGSGMSLMGAVGQGLIGLLLWFVAFHMLGKFRAAIGRRTKGDYLLSPWPSEGLTEGTLRSTSFEKFLPVDSASQVPGPAPEVF